MYIRPFGGTLDREMYDLPLRSKTPACRSATGIVQIKGPEMGHLAQFIL
eukprot:COSAG01_NODE_65612_length_272_cov_8.473988_1_plen_48_part_01